ncbi:transcriptional regulator [Ruminococcus albus SY3]|uniref:Transcriptional regulator n=1 Tax=Ruminococcus albus SY3 TaxID=1341156 RepID=A0A011V2D0_RUMAL|nr:transcriptional regulator [Ruminococcus albus SY3]
MGERINTLIAVHDTSQKVLADHLEVKPNVVSDFCHGKRTPNTEQIVKIADFFNVSADYLLNMTNIQTTDTDLQAVCKYTGLSENAVEKLHEFYTAEYGHRYVERINKSVEIESIENCPEFNDYAMNFINHLITDDDFANIIKRAVKLKEDIAEMKATIPDDESNEQAQMLLTRQNRKILLRAKRFVVTDDGYIDLMKEKLKSIFGTILDHIIDK